MFCMCQQRSRSSDAAKCFKIRLVQLHLSIIAQHLSCCFWGKTCNLRGVRNHENVQHVEESDMIGKLLQVAGIAVLTIASEGFQLDGQH